MKYHVKKIVAVLNKFLHEEAIHIDVELLPAENKTKFIVQKIVIKEDGHPGVKAATAVVDDADICEDSPLVALS